MDCFKCPKRSRCRKLCAEAEEYVNQDYVPQSELIMDDYFLDDILVKEWWEQTQRHGSVNISLSHREHQILVYLILTKPKDFYKKMSKLIGITEKNLSVVLTKLRKKLIK